MDQPLAVATLAEANDRDGTDWRLAGRLDGGVQSGAWRLESADGAVAVLKLALTEAWAEQMSRAAGGVAVARAAGYPTPAWLSTGITTTGIGYQVQELVAGRPVDRIGVDEARAVIDVLESQAGIDPDPSRNWNDFLAGDLSSGLQALRAGALRSGEPGERLAGVCDDLLRPAVVWSTLPRTDLVHGDLRPGNLLWDGSRLAGVIDIEAIGSGTRVFDYATLLDHPTIDPAALELIIAAALEAAGPAALRSCFAQVALDLVRFMRGSVITITGPALSERIEQLIERAQLVDRLSLTV